MIQNNLVLLLKGERVIKKFRDTFKPYMKEAQKKATSYSLLTYGRPVYKIEHLQHSYQDAAQLIRRQFFVKKGSLRYPTNSYPNRHKPLIPLSLKQHPNFTFSYLTAFKLEIAKN